MKDVLSRRTKRAFHSHQFARERYLNKLGVSAEEASFSENDLMRARLRYSLSMLQRRAFQKHAVLRSLVFSLISAALFAGMALLAGLHHRFPSEVVAILIALGITPLALALSTTHIARSFMDSWMQMIELVRTTGDEFNESVAEDLHAVGIEVLERHSLGRYVSNRGVVTLVTVDGELEALINGKILQVGYQHPA